jgi:hypothetical protein
MGSVGGSVFNEDVQQSQVPQLLVAGLFLVQNRLEARNEAALRTEDDRVLQPSLNRVLEFQLLQLILFLVDASLNLLDTKVSYLFGFHRPKAIQFRKSTGDRR